MNYIDARKGLRVRLVSCTDLHTRLEPGALGTVVFVDDLGTVHVRWDDGHQLGLIQGEDRFDVVMTTVVQSRRNSEAPWVDAPEIVGGVAAVNAMNADIGWRKYRVAVRPAVAS